MSAWALAGDPETQARPRSLSLLVAVVCGSVGSYFNPPLSESGEVRWEDSGADGQALARVENSGEGKGRPPSAFMFWHLWEAQCCLRAVPFGCRLDPCPPLRLFFPFPTVGLQAAVTLVIPAAWAPAGAVETPPARASQPEPPPWGVSQCALCGQPPPGCSSKSSVVSGCPPGKTESEEQTLGGAAVSRSPGPSVTRVDGQGFNELMTRVSSPVLYLHRIWAYSGVKAYTRYTCFCDHVPVAFAMRAKPRSFVPHSQGPCGILFAGLWASPLTLCGKRVYLKS